MLQSNAAVAINQNSQKLGEGNDPCKERKGRNTSHKSTASHPQRSQTRAESDRSGKIVSKKAGKSHSRLGGKSRMLKRI